MIPNQFSLTNPTLIPEATLFGTDGDDSLIGSINDDTINGLSGNDTIQGLAGNDTIIGRSGDDYLYGQKGNDSLTGGKGNDSLYGGVGFDTIVAGIGDQVFGGKDSDTLIVDLSTIKANLKVDYSDARNGLISTNKTDTTIIFKDFESIFLQTGSGNDEINLTAATGFSIIESGEGNDSIITGIGGDSIYAGSGNDTLMGNEGNDWLDAGTGVNQVFGGDGYDRMLMDLSVTTGDLTIDYQDINNGTISNGSLFTGIEAIQSLITGSGNDNINITAAEFANLKAGAGDDLIIGAGNNANNSINNFLYGEAGNDTIIGSIRTDNIFGDEGNDSLDGDKGDDNLSAGSGIDTILGGGGKDFLLIDLAAETQDLLVDYTNSSQGTISNGTIFSDIERIHLNTGAGNDTINISSATYNEKGTKQGSLVYSGAGNDQIITGFSNDFVDAGAGNDIVNGGEGNDYSLGKEGNDLLNGSFGNDSLLGQEDNDTINGESGNDSLNGGIGDDLLNGGDGNDRLDGGDGNNILNGGAGNDFFYSYAGVNQVFGGEGIDSIQIDLFNATEDITVSYLDVNNGTVSNGTTFIEIETYYVAGGNGNDNINMSAGLRGSLLGNQGNDTITGGSDNDYIFGGVGDDSLIGGGGNDNIFAAEGNDYIDGGAGVNRMLGYDGNDILVGGLSSDTLIGENGNDTLTGSSGNDSFGYNAPTEGIDLIQDFVSGKDQILIDNSFDPNLSIGTLSANEFVLGTQALDSSDHFIYNQSSGALFYDADGSGAKAQIQLATLANQATLTNTDIRVDFFF